MGRAARVNQSSLKAFAHGYTKPKRHSWSLMRYLTAGIPSRDKTFDPFTGLWTREEFVARVLDFGPTSRRYATVDEHRAFVVAHNRVSTP